MKRPRTRAKFKRFQFTAISLILGIFLTVLAHLFDLDYFEFLDTFFQRHEKFELDEVFMILLLLLPGVFIDYLISRSQVFAQKKQIIVFRSTMFNVNHTVNNLLNQIQYFYYITSEGRQLSPEELEEFEKLIQAAKEDIQLLNTIDEIPEDLSTGVTKIRLG